MDLIYSLGAGTKPIYRQIVERVTHLVSSGQLAAGAAMPSVRQTAISLVVNPMTASKAYSILAANKILEHVAGGCLRVAPRQSASSAELGSMLEPYLWHVVEVGSDLGFDGAAVSSYLAKIVGSGVGLAKIGQKASGIGTAQER